LNGVSLYCFSKEATMAIVSGQQIKRDEEILRNTLRAALFRAGALLGWLLLIVGICLTVLLLR
jgi:hypothetical protein